MAIKKAVFSVSGYSIVGSGKVDFADPNRLGFEAKLELEDIPYAMQGVVAGRELSITGDYGLNVSARSAEGGNYVSIHARSLPVPIAGGLFLATVDADGRFATLRDWHLAVADLSLAPAGDAVSAMPSIALAGDFLPTAADLQSLRIEDRYSALDGKAALDYSLASPLAVHIKAKLAAQVRPASGAGLASKSVSATESYDLDLGYSGGNFQGMATFVAAPLARFGKLPLEGSIDGRATFGGDLDDPALGFTLALRDGRYREQSLALSGTGSYSKRVLELRDVAAAYQGQSISKGALRFSLIDASSDLSLSFSGSLGGEKLVFSLGAKGDSRRGPSGNLSEKLASYEVKGNLRELAIGPSATAAWPFKLSADEKGVSFAGGTSGELLAKYGTGGLFSASMRAPFPVRADVSGLFDGKNIDLSVQGLDFDLALLSPLIPPEIIKLTGGRARGGFRAIGLATDPDITGEIDLEGASVKVVGWIADDIGPFNAPIVALGRKVSASVPSASSGKASVALACQATFDHWLPTGLTASARSIGAPGLHLDAVIMGIHAKGDAAADLRLALQGDVLYLNADVTLERATVVVGSEAFASANAQQSASPDVNLSVSTNVHFGRGVQVTFSPISIPVVTGNADPTSALAIRYDQATSDFSLKGSVNLRGGEVFYVQRNFFLKNGKIVFNEGGDRFDPRITVLAELRDRNDQGPVLITLRTENTPISAFKPTLSSDPVMSEGQIAGLLGQNLIGATSDTSLDIRKAAISASISASELIPQFDVVRLYENKVRDAFGLDILYLRTQVIQNFLSDISGQTNNVSGNPLARYFDQTSIYVGKYLNDSIYTYGSIGFQESAPLVGTDTSIINWDLGIELDAPFGRLTWALAPEDWKNLKFSDQSLSLSWKLSY